MVRGFLVALALVAAPGWAQVSHPVALAEYLCTADSMAIAPEHNNLSAGLRSVALSWNPSASTPDWYRVYRSAPGGAFALIADCVRGLTYTDFTVANGQTYVYVVRAVLAGQESGDSNQAAPSIPVFDTLAISQGHKLALAQSLTTSDVLARTAALRRSFAESLSTGDALAQSGHHSRSLSETLTTSGTLVTTFTDPNSIDFSEDLATGDAFARGATLGRGWSESLATLDSVQVAHGFALRAKRPVLVAMIPTQAAVSACSLSLSVSGLNFTAQSVVYWNEDALSTTYISPRQLEAVVPANELATQAPAALSVRTAGGGHSMALPFRTVAANATVLLIRISQRLLIVTGRDFVPSDVLLWDGMAMVTQYISSSQLQAGLPGVAFGLTSARGHSVTVEDTRCGAP